ncbi:hypothetical protein GF386_05850 [Candidatus Pacearchaeota archaeon]|nr:hypothetical protein [Candidatus Pacearchaeota archaeon]MBD3283617.1 hypothetical protein [Candidatus Pacearchaeota archaeon]
MTIAPEVSNSECRYREDLERHLSSLGEPDFEEMFRRMREKCHRPCNYAVDPRFGNSPRVVFCPERRKRPHVYEGRNPCPICNGDVDKELLVTARRLSSGAYAFAQANSFSFLNPDETFDLMGEHGDFRGINFLAWPTTQHKDIGEMPYEDHALSFDLIGELEQRIFNGKFHEPFGFKCCQVVKNTGGITGNHLHGAYHVAFVSRFPQNIRRDFDFLNQTEEPFISWFNRKNPKGLVVRDYETFSVAVPHFMKRPLEAIIYPKDEREWIGDLDEQEKLDLSRATSDVSYALSLLMPAKELQLDFSLVFHTGPGKMYIEVLPSSQRPGGFERAGLYVCEESPVMSARIYRKFFETYGKDSPGNRYNKMPSPEVRKEIRIDVLGE